MWLKKAFLKKKQLLRRFCSASAKMAVNGLEQIPVLIEDFGGPKTLKHNCLILESGKREKMSTLMPLQ